MPSPFVYRLINGYINGSTIKVGQGRKAFFGFAPTIDTEPFLFYGFAPTIDTEPFLFYGFAPTIDTEPFLFYGFAPTIDTEPFLFRVYPDFAPISDREPQKRHLHTQVP